MKYILLAVGILVGVGCLSLQASAADTYRLEQWIAPLECTENEIVNGVSTTTYLTPEECDDLLNPPPKPNPETPRAPNTGYVESFVTGILVVAILALIVLLRMVRRHRV